jgi:hypothetical protein
VAEKPFDPAEIARQLEIELISDFGETVFAVLRNLITRSPVGNPTRWQNPAAAPEGYVGGHFRRNWIVSIGSVDNTEIEGIDRSGAPTLATGRAKIASYEKSRRFGQVVIIQNNVPYANRLALGHSTLAEAGWVDEEVDAALSIPGGSVDLK